jgi:hypothetical protein
MLAFARGHLAFGGSEMLRSRRFHEACCIFVFVHRSTHYADTKRVDRRSPVFFSAQLFSHDQVITARQSQEQWPVGCISR